MDPLKSAGRQHSHFRPFFENSFNSIGRWDNFQKMFRCELSGEAATGGWAPTFALSVLFDVCSKIRSQFCKTLRQFSKQVSGNLGAPCPSWTQYKIDGAIWRMGRHVSSLGVWKVKKHLLLTLCLRISLLKKLFPHTFTQIRFGS